MKIAILGYGTVGKSLDELLCSHPTGIEVKKILRRPGKAEGPRMTESLEEILKDPEITAVAEVLSGVEPAAEYIRRALSAGKHVVSANKAALASDLPGLISLAEASGVSLLFEASCGGGIPWLESIKKARLFDEISSLKGILNGTGNYILDAMERQGLDFSQVLEKAQALGYAEADPSADIDGFDVYNKTLISCSLAYGGVVTKDFPVLGIRKVTKELLEGLRAEGKSLRLMMLSRRERDRYAMGVAPLILPADSIEANVQENYNCASFTGDVVGELKFYGQGAGGYPTADAMIGDLIQLREGTARPVELTRTLVYDEGLLQGTGYFADGLKKEGTLSQLAAYAREKDIFMAFSYREEAHA